jgi:hypothetical protein
MKFSSHFSVPSQKWQGIGENDKAAELLGSFKSCWFFSSSTWGRSK